MLGLKYLLSKSILRNIAYVQAVLVGLLVTPVIIRTLGDVEYGKWILLNTLLVYFLLFDFGFSSSVSRYISKEGKNPDKQLMDKYISSSFITMCVSFVLSLIAVSFIYNFAVTSKVTLSEGVLHASMYLIFSYACIVPLRIFHGVLRSQLRWNTISSIEIVKSLSSSGIVVTLVLSGYGLEALIYTNATCILIENIMYFVFSRRALAYSISFRNFDLKILIQLAKYSLSFFITSLSTVLGRRAQPFIIATYLDLSTVTLYSVGSQLIMYFQEMMISIFDILTPYFSRNEENQEGLIDDFINISEYSFAFALFGGLMILEYAQTFLYYWLGKDFLGSYRVIQFLIIPYILYLSHIPSRGLLFGTSKQRFLVVLSVTECIVIFCSLFVAVRFFGLDGILFCMFIIMTLFRGIIFPVFLFDVMKIPFKKYILRVYFRTLCIFFLPQLGFHWVLNEIGRFSLSVAYVAVVQVALFLGTLFFVIRQDVRNAT